ncbi:hypothetical protein VNO77_16418 [Canavalia gladiata]|uniref:Carbohydrate kinase PfkB domain-containing protein n=1 Tax=Canavalia gladiata TaxID=3824 RepID=A0AAN9M111_CANGL
MPLPSKLLKSPIQHGPSISISISNPKPKPKPSFIFFSLNRPNVFACKGIEFAVPTPSPHSIDVAAKNVDVATLSNLCVDIVLNVPQLPPPSPIQRKAFMDRLARSPPNKKYWEAGGNCNMAIAAARLGLNCISIGHVGNEIYGKFLSDVLHEEGIGMVGMITNDDIAKSSNGSDASYATLLCWVLVDPLQRHGFCSRADFSNEPAFHWMNKVSREVKMAIKNSKVLFCNGYGFDELSPGVLLSAMEYAVEVGTSVFFDPGPRGKSLSTGTPEERRALNQFLRMSDVLLLTSDEAESLTGIADPILAGLELLRRGIRTKWVIVKMGPRGSILITASSIACAPAFKVNVIDTVGCGDSFVAAIAYGFIHNMPMVNTLAIANAVGAATAMGCGAGRNVATLEKVVRILRSSDLNEDVEFWTDLFENNVVAQEIICLTKVMNGNRNRVNLVPFDKVTSELLPKLEFPRTVGNVPT